MAPNFQAAVGGHRASHTAPTGRPPRFESRPRASPVHRQCPRGLPFGCAMLSSASGRRRCNWLRQSSAQFSINSEPQSEAWMSPCRPCRLYRSATPDVPDVHVIVGYCSSCCLLRSAFPFAGRTGPASPSGLALLSSEEARCGYGDGRSACFPKTRLALAQVGDGREVAFLMSASVVAGPPGGFPPP